MSSRKDCCTAVPQNSDGATFGEEPVIRLREAMGVAGLEAFSRHQKVGRSARRAAYGVAVALGRCRLFGVKVPPDLEGVLPGAVATAAAEWGCHVMREFGKVAKVLDKTFDDDAAEGEEDALQCLEVRMDIWAAKKAIEEAYEAEQVQSRVATRLTPLANAFRIFLEAAVVFDGILQRNTESLAVASETSLLENWRQALAQGSLGVTPWWLDGTLESKAAKIAKLVRADKAEDLAAALGVPPNP